MKKIFKMFEKVIGFNREYSQVPESALAEYRMGGKKPVVFDQRAMAMIDAGVAP